MGQVNTIWSYNGVELELDLQDVAVIERYEAAFAAMAQAEQSIPKAGAGSEILRAYCLLFVDLFNTLFGLDDAADRLFGGRLSATLCEDAYTSLLDFVRAQKDQAAGRRNAIVQKYSSNRAQRRAK